MRIVHLTQTTVADITGGLEYHVHYLAAALRRLGHEVIVVGTDSLAAPVAGRGFFPASATRWRPAFLPAFVRLRLDVLCETLAMFARRWLKLRHGARVAEHVNRLKPDLVHQHSYIGELRACRLIARKYPLVFTNHTGAYLHLNRWAPTRFLQRRLMCRFSMAIAPSRELLPDTDNSHYVPNGVDTATFFPVPRAERAQLASRYDCTGRQVFLCARRWAPTKGIIYLAKSLRRLSPETRKNCVFIFCGNETPGYRKYQQNIHAELAGTGCDVRILGNLDHAALAELMNIATACILPSLMEATSLACLESMACATPVIGTRTGGLLELIREGDNGWLVPVRDEGSLASRIESILAIAPHEMRRIRQCTLDGVRRNYTWDAAAISTEKIYQAAIRSRK